MPLFGPPNVEKLIDRNHVKGLIKALGYTKDARIRRQAAVGLGALGNRQAVPPLIGALQDENAGVRRCAATALGELGDVQAVDPLIAVLSGFDSSVRQAAVRALAKMPDPRALAPLASLFKGEWGNSDTRVQMLQMFKALGATELLIGALKDKQEAVRLEAVRALSERGDLQTIEPLAAALDNLVSF